MALNGKELHGLIMRRKDRQAEVKREAQGMLFSTREAEFEYLAERARSTLQLPVEEIEAERERSRRRKNGIPI